MKHCLPVPPTPAARARSATLAFALALLAGTAHAQAPAAAPLPPGLQPDVAAAAPVPGALPLQRSRSTLKQLGLDYEVTLRGVQGTAGIPFSIRSDQVVDHAALHLKYTYSPALLPDLSHLRVTVNDVTVATLPVSAEEAGRPVERDVAIDPRLVTGYNRVNLQLIGHYTRECEDPDHSSLWANIDSASYLELGWLPLPLSNDLALLPVPFFDARDTRRLELPFVFAGQPANGQLQAAGIVSSWFGALAGYRGAMFPVSTGMLPARGNAVVVATPRNLPAGVAPVEVSGPTLAVASNPNDAGGKLLLVLGRDDAELRAAATALALGAPLSGASATLREVKDAAPRKPYDAPNWVPSDRPVRFSELVRSTSELNVVGYNPDLIRIGLQLPPDLFVWRKDGIPVDLRYRYTLPEGADKSALNISINDAFVTTLPLNGRPLATSVPQQLWQKLGARGAMPIQQPLLLPTGPLSASSQLRFHFFFDRPRAEECKNTFPDVSASIDDASTIDLSGFAHYMAMPNLAAFGNAGFPFTRMADLSDSALVMPDNASGDDVANALALLGRMGASTGYPALRTRVIQARQVDEHADQDLLVLGSRRNQPLFARWAAAMPVGDGAQARRFGLSDWLFNTLPAFLSPDARRTDLPTVAEVGVRPQAGDVLLLGFESPLRKGRSVVALMADEPGHVNRLFEAWFDPARLRRFQGSVVLLQGDTVRSLAGNQTYYVGELPPLLALRWFFAHHPLWLALGVGLVCLLLAMLAGWLLRRHARARLKVAG
ncbi:Cyclic di-GMP-binding protein [Stenotrophomonas acidaminiphila]|uniref:Cyclic di-GMP-binding protein n=1 Tax=Stenotrophomonas acidaminiphila TaxID=128780 RepID=A0A0S1B2W1_9GAMM|nr:cellulose biosynthesis cyclic di-GMP-binding regulatory protein BcsB [Stenotrophomonas acidaminiphila]ALJ29389.1 Cyclic di-GMP-binding protein [Stenotrophomonas acidaminiphila]